MDAIKYRGLYTIVVHARGVEGGGAGTVARSICVCALLYIWVTGWGSAERALGGRDGVRGRACQSATGVAEAEERSRFSMSSGETSSSGGGGGWGGPAGGLDAWLGAGAAGAAAGAAAAGMRALSNTSAAADPCRYPATAYKQRIALLLDSAKRFVFGDLNLATPIRSAAETVQKPIHCRNRGGADPHDATIKHTDYHCPSVRMGEANVSHTLVHLRLAQALISHSSLITATCSCAWPPRASHMQAAATAPKSTR